jgi:hypothetical protein
MADERPLVEQLLDVALYAPIGAAVVASEQVPALVARGRAQLEGRVTVARMVGRLAVSTARRRLGDGVVLPWGRGLPGSAGGAQTGDRGAAGPTGAETVDARGGVEPASRTPSTPAGRARRSTPQRPAGEADQRSVPEVTSLAVPGYDALAASQVVRRLDGLSGPELEAIYAYESATRRRQTILGRVAQLRGDASAGG